MSRPYQAGPTWRAPRRQRIAPRDVLEPAAAPTPEPEQPGRETSGFQGPPIPHDARPPIGLWALVKWIIAAKVIAAGMRRLPWSPHRLALADAFVAYLETDLHRACETAAGRGRT